MPGYDALHTDGAVTDSRDARHAQGGMIAKQGPTILDVRTGVCVGPGSTALVTGTAATGTMTVSIAPHVAVGLRSTADGPYLGPTLEAATTVNIAAAPGANSRIDVVWAKQRNAASTVSPDASTAPEYGVTTGTAAASPVKPSIPVGAVELATVQVAVGATATNGAGVTITNTAKQVVAAGAPVPVRSQTERDALTAFAGLQVYRIDTGAVELYTSSWQTLFSPSSKILGYESGATAFATAGTAEERVTATECNITASLVTGRAYRARFKGRLSASSAGALLLATLRLRSGATPITTSTAVAGDQKYMTNGGGTGQQDVDIEGLFAVSSSATWHMSLFLKVGAGTGTAAVIDDIRGRMDTWFEDVGPSFSGILTV